MIVLDPGPTSGLKTFVAGGLLVLARSVSGEFKAKGVSRGAKGGQWEEIEVTGVKSERADRLLAAFILSREGFSARL